MGIWPLIWEIERFDIEENISILGQPSKKVHAIFYFTVKKRASSRVFEIHFKDNCYTQKE